MEISNERLTDDTSGSWLTLWSLSTDLRHPVMLIIDPGAVSKKQNRARHLNTDAARLPWLRSDLGSDPLTGFMFDEHLDKALFCGHTRLIRNDHVIGEATTRLVPHSFVCIHLALRAFCYA